jgi:hypothetical protein
MTPRFALWTHYTTVVTAAVNPEAHDPLRCTPDCIHRVRYTYPTVVTQVKVIEIVVSPGHMGSLDYVPVEFKAVIIDLSTGQYHIADVRDLKDDDPT